MGQGMMVITKLLGWLLQGLIRAATAPLWATVRVYSFFAVGTRYVWFDLVWIAVSMYLTGMLIVIWLSSPSIGDKLLTSAVFGVVLMVMGAISEWIKSLPASSALRFLGWVPFMTWRPGQAQTWADQKGTQDGKTVLRGAQVIDGQAAAQQLRAASGGKDMSLNITLGGVPLDVKNEAEHFLISGKTGAGKTQAINAMLRTVRARQQPAIIADPAGGYLQRFGQEGEFILNPFDSRDAGWSPFLELSEDYDCPRIAKAAIPDGTGDSKEWHFYAQTLFGAVLRSQWKAGNFSVKELLRLVMAAPVSDLVGVLAGTSAAILTAKGNEKMLSNTRAIASTYLSVWSYLPDMGQFSVRRWVQAVGEGQHSRWLYLTYQDSQMAMLRTLVATWLELAIVEGLSLSEQPDRRLWFIMDELDSLGKVTSLRAGLTKLRKYGGVCVNGLQTVAQLRDTYGQDEAQTLLSCMSTKLILAAGDAETGETMSKEIGDQEFEREKLTSGTSSQSMQIGSGQSNNKTTEHRTERAVLASEVTTLPNLRGFLKPVGRPVMRIELEYVSMDNKNAAFVSARA